MRIIGVETAPEHGYGRALLDGVSNYAARKCDARLQSVSQDNPFSAARNSTIDGLIIRILSDKTCSHIMRRNIPTVDIYGEKARPGIAQVIGDFHKIAELAADFFLARGYRNIGWCGIGGLFFSTETERHFTDILTSKGHTVLSYNCTEKSSNVIVCNAPDHIADARKMRRWLQSLPKPCAVFCCNDHRAFQLMRIATESGLAVPEDISILGIDNDTTICAFADVPISSIDPDAFRLGQTAARILDTIISKPPSNRIHRPILIPPKCLIERQSTQHFPVSPAWLAKALVAIDQNLAINATDVIALTGYSAPTVELALKRLFNKSIIGYITEQRMQRARKLLATTDLMIKQVAAECGFASQQYFCNAFKSYFGHSPASQPTRLQRTLHM